MSSMTDMTAVTAVTGMLTTYLKTAPSMGAVYFFYDLFSRSAGLGGLNRYRTTPTI